MAYSTILPVGVDSTHVFQYFLPAIQNEANYCSLRTPNRIALVELKYSYSSSPTADGTDPNTEWVPDASVMSVDHTHCDSAAALTSMSCYLNLGASYNKNKYSRIMF